MSVLVAKFSQETNSFCSVFTGREKFSPWDGNSELTGFSAAMRESGYDVVVGPLYRAQASGPVKKGVVDTFLQEVRACLDGIDHLDAAYVELHGATQSLESDDVCGDITTAIRAMIGETPLAASVDLHANVTLRFFTAVDALSGYQTYPHRDAVETGRRAAKLCLQKMRGLPCYAAHVRVPMINPASGYTTDAGPFARLVARAHEIEALPEVLDYTICQMQPWLDVHDGASTVMVSAVSPEIAEKHALSLAEELFSIRKEMEPVTDSMEEIVTYTRSVTDGRPVIVSDFSDSPNAGAAGDNVDILRYLLENAPEIKAAVILNDAKAAEQAFACGVGGSAQFSLGGTLDPTCSKPVSVTARVRSLHDGSFLLGGPMMRGVEMEIGRCAVLTAGNIDILVCPAMCITGDTQLYRHFGIEPSFYQLVVVKANTSFRVSYQDITDHVKVCDTCCTSTANLKALPWKHLPPTLYPFCDPVDYVPAQQLTVVSR